MFLDGLIFELVVLLKSLRGNGALCRRYASQQSSDEIEAIRILWLNGVAI